MKKSLRKKLNKIFEKKINKVDNLLNQANRHGTVSVQHDGQQLVLMKEDVYNDMQKNIEALRSSIQNLNNQIDSTISKNDLDRLFNE